MMKVSDNCIQLVKHYEGLRLEAYVCPSGKITIGYGTTRYPSGIQVKMGDHCTEAQAEGYMHYWLDDAAETVQRYGLKLNQNELDAVCSFIYNFGFTKFYKSTLYRLINLNPKDQQIGTEFYKWVNSGGKPLKGLQNRRLSEYHLYATGKLKFDWI